MPMWSEVSRRPLSLTWMGRRLWVPAFAGTTATPAQNVGNGGTHLLRLAAIRATLGPPGVLSNQALTRLSGFNGRGVPFGPPGFSVTARGLGSGGFCNEGHRRTRAIVEIAGPR